MVQFSILIVSSDDSLEILLKQYFADISIATNLDRNIFNEDILIIDNAEDFDIIIDGKSWNVSKPVSINHMINIIEIAKQVLSVKFFTIGPIYFYPDQKICKLDKQEISLTEKETEILIYLLKHKKEVNKLDLLNSIWKYSGDISTHTLETHIYNLRNKFSHKYDIILSNENGYFINLSEDKT